MKKILALMAAAMMLVFTAGTAQAVGNQVPFTGQGIYDGQLGSVVCDYEETPYLLWVLTVNGSGRTATITGPWGTEPMTQSGNGSFKYQSEWFDLDTLDGVFATYSGTAKTGVQLVISHGCPGDTYPPS